MSYREREIAAYLDAARMARRIAHQCRGLAIKYPRHAEAEMAECARAFDRARWYLDSARMMRRRFDASVS